MNNNQISISNRNSKMGEIASFSLPAVITCNPNAPCFKECYAVKLERIYKGVRDSYTRNYDIVRNSPESFKAQLNAVLAVSRFFRMHVSGDFFSYEYFCTVAELVKNNPHCTVLAFTKQYEFVNRYIKDNGALPLNFKVIFSRWKDFRGFNPYNLPESAVIFKDDEIPDDWKICGGNCAECACRGCGCWELKAGEVIAFHKH